MMLFHQAGRHSAMYIVLRALGRNPSVLTYVVDPATHLVDIPQALSDLRYKGKDPIVLFFDLYANFKTAGLSPTCARQGVHTAA